MPRCFARSTRFTGAIARRSTTRCRCSPSCWARCLRLKRWRVTSLQPVSGPRRTAPEKSRSGRGSWPLCRLHRKGAFAGLLLADAAARGLALPGSRDPRDIREERQVGPVGPARETPGRRRGRCPAILKSRSRSARMEPCSAAASRRPASTPTVSKRA